MSSINAILRLSQAENPSLTLHLHSLAGHSFKTAINRMLMQLLSMELTDGARILTTMRKQETPRPKLLYLYHIYRSETSACVRT